MVQEKTKKFIKFKDVTEIYTIFGKFQGLKLSGEPVRFSKLRFIIHQMGLGQMFLMGAVLMVLKHLEDENQFLSDCRTLNTCFGQSCVQFYGLILYLNQDKLRSLMSWCEDASDNGRFDEESTFKVVKFLYYLSYLQAFCHSINPILVGFVTNQRLLPVPVYFVDQVWGSTGGYILVFASQVYGVICLWQYGSFLLATFYVLVKHISGQYTRLSSLLKEVGNESEAKTIDQIEEIGMLHSELLMKIKEISSIFKIVLLLNEAVGVICVVISVAIMRYEREETLFAVMVFFFGVSNFAYPYMGEEICSSAEKFALATMESNWLNLSTKQRKKLAMIILVSQKPVGLSTAGFHFSNYLEISQVG